MNEKTEQLIRELASKLGTTVEHLWGVLVKQAPIEAATNLGCFLLFGVILGLIYRYAKKLFAKQHRSDGEDAVLAICCAAFVIVGVVFLLLFVSEVSMITAGFFNPEYWALKQIIK